jgi:hypothetical protein
LQAFRDGNYNQVEGAKILADEQINNYRNQIAELDEVVTSLKKENTNLKLNQEKN